MKAREKMYKFCGYWRKFINFVEIGHVLIYDPTIEKWKYAICIIGLGGMDAPALTSNAECRFKPPLRSMCQDLLLLSSLCNYEFQEDGNFTCICIAQTNMLP